MKVVLKMLMVMALVMVCMTASASEYKLSSSFKRSFAIVQQWINQDKSRQALERLNGMAARHLNPYERALVAQTRGFLLAQNEDYSGAIKAFERALKEKSLSGAAEQRLHYNLGQLYMTQEKFKPGVKHLEAWLESDKQGDPAVYSWLGYAYYQFKDYAKAEGTIKEALRKYSPVREWYQILSAIYLESARYGDSVKLLKQAITIFPNDHFLWRQLASSFLYGQKEMDALTVLMLSKQIGAYESYDIPLMAQLFRRIDAPYYGAKLIQSAIDGKILEGNYRSYRLLAECLSQARESDEAVNAYEKAAKYSDNGDMYFRRGELLIGLERWQDAEDSLVKAIDRGLDHSGQAYYLKGISLHEQGKLSESLASFRQALNDKRVNRYAEQWIKRLEARSGGHKG